MKGFLQRILQEIMKKIIILGTSDAWLTIHLSQRQSKPAYYIEDCRILTTVKAIIMSNEQDKTVWEKIVINESFVALIYLYAKP